MASKHPNARKACKRAIVHPLHREHLRGAVTLTMLELAAIYHWGLTSIETIMCLTVAVGELLAVIVAVGLITMDESDLQTDPAEDIANREGE